MSTKLYTIEGQAVWAKVYEPDVYNDVAKYKIGIIPSSAKDWNTIKESGLRTKTKKLEDGREYITLSRPSEGKMNKEGEEYGGGKPLVLGPEKEPFTALIGNDSVVEVLFATYDTKMGKGHRLETVMVKEHVKYEPMDGEEDTQGLSWKDRPAPVKKEEEVVKEVVEPTLPF